MSATVHGGPTHWRANLDELLLGVAKLRGATAQTMQLAGEATVAGGLLAGITIMTPQGPLIGAKTLMISSGLIAMRGEVELLAHGVQTAVDAYVAVETRITSAVTLALTPTAVVLSLLGATTELDVPNDMYELAIRGTTTAVWVPIETAVDALDQTAPGTKFVLGNAIGWTLGLEQNIWQVPPTRRTYGMLAHALQLLGLIQLAPYDVDNVTADPAPDGWHRRDPLDPAAPVQAMELLQEYAYADDTVTVAKLQQPDGSDAYAVIYSGTTPLGDEAGPMGLLGQEAAFGAAGVVEAVAADSVHVEAATLDMLARAGVPAGARIMPMGYSQGGTHALNVALSDKVKSTYQVTDVLTVAAPTGHRTTDDLELNMVHIEHEHDKVTALTGAHNEARLNRTTIEVQGYPNHEVHAGVFGPEHNFAMINGQLSVALEDPTVQQAAQLPLARLDQKLGGAVAIQQFKLTRQQPSVVAHPTGARPNKHPKQPISIRPLDEWLTGTVPR